MFVRSIIIHHQQWDVLQWFPWYSLKTIALRKSQWSPLVNQRTYLWINSTSTLYGTIADKGAVLRWYRGVCLVHMTQNFLFLSSNPDLQVIASKKSRRCTVFYILIDKIQWWRVLRGQAVVKHWLYSCLMCWFPAIEAPLFWYFILWSTSLKANWNCENYSKHKFKILLIIHRYHIISWIASQCKKTLIFFYILKHQKCISDYWYQSGQHDRYTMDSTIKLTRKIAHLRKS